MPGAACQGFPYNFCPISPDWQLICEVYGNTALNYSTAATHSSTGRAGSFKNQQGASS